MGLSEADTEAKLIEPINKPEETIFKIKRII